LPCGRARLGRIRLQAQRFAAEKVSGMYKPGPDISLPLIGRDLDVEVKLRARRFATIYWLQDRDVLIVRANRREPIVAIPLRLAIEIAKKAEG
jgi:hypothetical protein